MQPVRQILEINGQLVQHIGDYWLVRIDKPITESKVGLSKRLLIEARRKEVELIVVTPVNGQSIYQKLNPEMLLGGKEFTFKSKFVEIPMIQVNIDHEPETELLISELTKDED